MHEDERRTLEDWAEAKVITAKKDCILGGHYHKIKTEKFMLLEGKCFMTIHTSIGDVKRKMSRGEFYTIDPGTKHSFKLIEGSVLLGLCSHSYDAQDDYK